MRSFLGLWAQLRCALCDPVHQSSITSILVTKTSTEVPVISSRLRIKGQYRNPSCMVISSHCSVSDYYISDATVHLLPQHTCVFYNCCSKFKLHFLIFSEVIACLFVLWTYCISIKLGTGHISLFSESVQHGSKDDIVSDSGIKVQVLPRQTCLV